MKIEEKIKQAIIKHGQPSSVPEIARIIHGGAAKTTTTHIRAIRKAVGEMVDAGEIVAAGSDQKRGQLYGLAVSDEDDDDGCGDTLAAGVTDTAISDPAKAALEAEKAGAETAVTVIDDIEEIAEEVSTNGLNSYIDGVIMSHAVHLTGQILAADPKTDKIWAADRALDAVRHIARRIEKEGAK